MSFVIGALGAVSVNFKEYMKRLGVNVWLEVIQKTALLGTVKDTKESTVPVGRIGPVVTCCNTLPRTINQGEHPA